MALLTDEVRAFIGVESKPIVACQEVQLSEIRRYAQAIMDEDPIYFSPEAAQAYGGLVAPPLFPSLYASRRGFGESDLISENATNPDFDGTPAGGGGLPALPLPKLALLNGGSEVEFFRYARIGEVIVAQSRYADIYERETSKGPMLFVVMEFEYRTVEGEPLLKNSITVIRR